MYCQGKKNAVFTKGTSQVDGNSIVATNSYNGFPPVFYKIRERTIEDIFMWQQHGNEFPTDVYSSRNITFIKQFCLVQIHWSKCCCKFNLKIL